MLKTTICDLFGIKYPIIQGGMAHLGTAELVSAVSNAGGLGIIGTASYEPDWVKQIAGLIKEIKPVKAIIDEIVTEAEAIIAGLKNFCSEN